MHRFFKADVMMNLVSTVGVDMESHKSPFCFLRFFSGGGGEGQEKRVCTVSIS